MIRKARFACASILLSLVAACTPASESGSSEPGGPSAAAHAPDADDSASHDGANADGDPERVADGGELADAPFTSSVQASDADPTSHADGATEPSLGPIVQDPGSSGYVARELVVKRAPGVTLDALRREVLPLGGVFLDETSLLSTELGFDRLQFADGASAERARTELVSRALLATAERNYLVPIEATPNDPSFGSLWGMSKIRAAEAWNTTTGSADVLVAITDTGIDKAHTDLTSNVYVNPGEIAGNGVDDDHNGLVDDVSGWDFANSDNSPADDHGHGTHVAGTIGAIGNNASGVVGVNWRVSILPIKVCLTSGCPTTAFVNGILYAAKMKVRVVNASLGGIYPQLSYERDAIAQLGAQGGMLVAAAGNSGQNNDQAMTLPASYDLDNIVAVAATDANDQLASFSNWGARTVDLAAPGVNIVSTKAGGGLTQMSGTSMATPHVTGALALYRAIAKDLTLAELKANLLASAVPLPSLSGKVLSGGRLDLVNLLGASGPCDGRAHGCDANATCQLSLGKFTCQCKDGYRGDGTSCQDIDECQERSAQCGPHAVCANTPGSYTCACAAGFSGNGVTCVDVDECESGAAQCDGNALCENTEGSYACTCAVGFAGDGHRCADVDECQEGTHDCEGEAVCKNTVGGFTCTCPPGQSCGGTSNCAPGLHSCDVNATCTNAGGSYRCRCNPGYAGNGFFCADINECTPSLDDCASDAACINTPGGHSCSCKTGYVGVGRACVDRDECQDGSARCDAHASCRNILGSYECACGPGYEGDGRTCHDVDECARGLFSCPNHTTCVNTDGGYACACAAGFAGDAAHCVDVDECAAKVAKCDEHASCTNTQGGYTCQCAAGYEGNGTQCADIDECARGLFSCGAHAECANTPGAYTCRCSTGFSGDGRTCVDIDECSSGQAHCAPGASCTNTVGGYNCACASGYVSNGTTCADVDECATGQHRCASRDACVNTSGGYTCKCPAGFEGDGYTCRDIDECTKSHPCGSHGTCQNQPGSFACVCASGYEWDGTSCVDIDECARHTSRCSADAECTNTPGNYTCKCKAGFTGGGFTCEDVDECGVGFKFCGEGASCKNTHGSAVCVCKPGFKGNGGGKCDDADECADGTATCSANATCTNTVSSYTCACKVGFVGDGHTCTDIDECKSGSVACPSNSHCANTPGSASCACNEGFEFKGSTCVDIDECARATARCSADATCRNTVGSYTCSCKAGYSGSGVTCTDTDECTSGAANCDRNATCHNEPGRYTCSCNSGYTGDGVTCAQVGDVDECANGTARCSANATCRNTTGSYSCQCKTGYTGDGVTCVDVDECQNGTAHCDARATCTNTAGGYSCACNAGTTGDGISCQGPDPCGSPSACSPYAMCTSSGNSRTCQCRPGYQGDGTTCIDVDECQNGSARCDTHATCTNVPGSYTCACAAGYQGNGATCTRDECALGLARCDANATCTDTAQSYTCQCKAGFEGDGTTCRDTDECAAHTDQCSSHGICKNEVGSYSCRCADGYSGNGFTCVAKPHSVVSVDTKGDHSCALLDNGAVRCWGRNDDGQLGYGHTRNIGDDEPAESAGVVDVGGKVVQIAVGVAHTCALLDNGAVRCWGRNSYGQLGYARRDNVGDDEAPRTAGDIDVGGAVVQIAAGGEHTCALLAGAGGKVRCWGLGIDGQLGYGNTNDIGDDETPRSVGDVDLGGKVTQITAGRDHTCALLDTGSVRCWGRGKWAPLGYGNTDNVGDDESPRVAGDVDVGGRVIQVAAGWYHTCAVLDSHAVRCWGYGEVGQLGYGNRDSIGDDETPRAAGNVDVGGVVSQVSTGLYHTCALLDGGAVRCWGYGLDGRLGYGNTSNVGDDGPPSRAGNVALGSSATMVRAGFAHTCAVLSSGAVRCWGSGEFGRLGTGNTSDVGDTSTPAGVTSILLSDVDECAIGTATCDVHASCSDTRTGFACSCAAGYFGDGEHCVDVDECAQRAVTCQPHATCSNTVGSYACLCDSGYRPSGALCADIDECAERSAQCSPDAICSNTAGSYGCACKPGFVGDGFACEPIPQVDRITAGGSHTCALLNNGQVRCWGSSQSGQLGYGNTQSIGDDEDPYLAGSVDLGGKVIDLAAGQDHTCAVIASGAVRCWGSNVKGQLGYGHKREVGDDETPASAGDVNLGGRATQVTCGEGHTCALLDSGAVRCWGGGEFGRLGYASLESVGDDEVPATAGNVDLGGAAIQVSAGGYHTCALLGTGAVRCWGLGVYGELGYGNPDSKGDDETPRAAGDVPVGGRVVQIATGYYHTCALLDRGSVRCWGYGQYGTVGRGNTSMVGNAASPAISEDIDIGGGRITQITASGYHTCALLETGNVRCWGYGAHGALGYGDTRNIGDNELPSSAGDVTLGSPAIATAAGIEHTCALFADHTVHCWGAAASGRLGYPGTADLGDNELPSSVGFVRVLHP